VKENEIYKREKKTMGVICVEESDIYGYESLGK
jgi:hypothetical protein